MKTKILAVRQGKVINPVSELHAKDVRIAELQDALEFSERVAAKLATIIHALTKDKPWPNILWPAVTPDKVLKWARLRVEEEMDGHNTM